jgi:hypothetical protein
MAATFLKVKTSVCLKNGGSLTVLGAVALYGVLS